MAKEDMYYIQDARNYVGNSVLWWRKEGAGYTTDLDEAMIVDSKWKGRESDILWPCSAIDKLATKQFDMQKLREIQKKVI